MPAALRGKDKNLVQQLLDEPHRFEFFQAVSMLLHWFAVRGVTRERALREHLRFDNSLSLSFAPGEIERLQVLADGLIKTEEDMSTALANQLPLQIHITPAFMGFLGAEGALPFHYTERIRDHELTHKDEAPRAFLDTFSNRALALLYAAWRKHRVQCAVSEDGDSFLPRLAALTGLRLGHDGPSPEVDRDRFIAHYAGVLRQRPVSAVVLGRVLSSYFGVPFEVEECVGRWNIKAPHEQTSLGAFNASLGVNAMLGESSWRPDLYARLMIGPLSRSAYTEFLPNAAGAQALKKLLGLFGDQAVTYEVVPMLRAADVPEIQLGGGPMAGANLGFDCFLVSGPSPIDRADMQYHLQPMAPLPRLPKRV